MKPEISLIIPVLDEEGEIVPLLENLCAQQGAALEVIFVDGGSRDGTLSLLAAADVSFPVRLLHTEKGRGVQLNAGGAAAGADLLLFLHADSRFPDPDALRRGIVEFIRGGGSVGHFSLRFHRSGPPSLPYFFYEMKARLDRPECIHGDQGLLVRRSVFERLAGFDAAAPVAPETRFVDRHRVEGGKCLLLSPEILTSPRRFHVEGLRERQTLNAILMNLAAAGRDDVIRGLKDAYAEQSGTGKLEIRPFLREIRRMVGELPEEEREEFWRRSTRHFRGHAWQIFFFLDVVRHVRRNGFQGNVAPRLLEMYERRLAGGVEMWPMRVLSHVLLAGWLRVA